MERWEESACIYRGKIIAVRVGKARLEDGTSVIREVVEHSGGVGVVPLVDGKVVLTRQYRISTGKHILELPAGRLEGDEDPEYRARIELAEEAGYRAGRLVHVASCYCSPGFTNEMDHIYLAFDLERTEQRLEFDERIEIVELPLAESERMLDEGAFEDAKTIIGLRELFRYLDKHNLRG
jgi:ADP-ribose pyrophosphatase